MHLTVNGMESKIIKFSMFDSEGRFNNMIHSYPMEILHKG